MCDSSDVWCLWSLSEYLHKNKIVEVIALIDNKDYLSLYWQLAQVLGSTYLFDDSQLLCGYTDLNEQCMGTIITAH